jgi:carboxypeptidase family protein
MRRSRTPWGVVTRAEMARPRILLAVILALVCASGLLAQDEKKKKGEPTTRVVQGLVLSVDDKGVPGAVVQLKDMRTLQIRSFISQENGGYHFSELKLDNDYQLKADYSGTTSGWKTLSVFDSRKEPIMNLKLDKKE